MNLFIWCCLPNLSSGLIFLILWIKRYVRTYLYNLIDQTKLPSLSYDLICPIFDLILFTITVPFSALSALTITSSKLVLINQFNMTITTHLARERKSLQRKVKNYVTSFPVPYTPLLFLCKLNACARTYYKNPTLLHVLDTMYVLHMIYLDFISPNSIKMLGVIWQLKIQKQKCRWW